MKIRQINLLNFGSLTTGTEKKESNENSLTNYFLYPANLKFIDKTNKLKGLLGLKFGIEYFIEGYSKAKYEDVTFYCRIVHPTLINTETRQQSSETTERKTNYLNETNFDYFSFEYDWEVKQGLWTFQIIEDDKILFEKSFQIQ